MKRVMLYFGSFNPIHTGHIALAEYAVEKGLCDELVLVVSPQSPYKQAEELAPEMDRFEMAETACAASRYPDRIKPSVVEFLLPKPSYTIDTLRYLAENHGADMEFSILMGADQIERLDGWKEYDRILEYPVYVYPRRGEREYAVEKGLCDELVLVVSPQSPYKQAEELAPEMDRFEMAETACAASRYPDRIKPSVVEFLLPKPSYTIDTLRYLAENHGADMEFSILMGADQIERLDGWKEYDRILEYPVYVYPRRGERVDRFPGRITVLEDAPLQDFSATQIRGRIGRGEDVSQMLDKGVAEHIRRKGLWNPTARKSALTAQIAADPENTALYMERGKLHYRLNEWGAALNDFNRVLQADDSHAEARQYAQMVREILEFRYKDIYNP